MVLPAMSTQVVRPSLRAVDDPDMPTSIKKLLERMAEEDGVTDADVEVIHPVPRDPLVFVRRRLVAGWVRP
jgi:hypothetical protein